MMSKSRRKAGGKPRELDCTKCGACCAAGLTIELADHDRTPRELTRLLPGTNWQNDLTGQLQRKLPVMKVLNNRCVALEGTVGERVACSVYDRRPSVCQAFQPGGERCLKIRRRHGFK